MRLPVKQGLVIAIFLILPVSLSAQGFFIGPRGGLAISGFWGDDADEWEDSLNINIWQIDNRSTADFSAGASIGYAFSDVFEAQMDILYDRKGRKWEDITIGNVILASEGELQLDYLEFPVLFKAFLPVHFPIKPFGYAGVSFAFLVNAEERVKIPSLNINRIYEYNLDNEELHTFDLGLAFGGGAEIDAGPGGIIFDIRFTPGFITTDKETASDPTEQDIKNWAWTFSTGYLIRF
jgi:hypothetical protein